VAINATTSNVEELRRVIAAAKQRKASKNGKTILFIDEIHRFNKAQQDVLLPDIEEGNPILIGATVHNPYFSIASPLVSRSVVCELKALKEKDKFGNPIATHPVLMKGGFLYQLDKKGEVEKIKHEQAETHDFSLSHNVMSGPNVIGARGCIDCHSKNSSFFLRKVLIDYKPDKIFVFASCRCECGP
jgi:hypothetical protein